MAFGDALLGIQQQLVPDEISGLVAATDDPTPLRGAPLAQLGSTVQQAVPSSLPEPNFTLTPDNSKRVKGIGKFISNLGEVLADPATQKALSSIGIGLDPRGVGGVLGQFGISLAEENARDQFRAAIAAGGDPSQIRISGLSAEGRQTVLNEGIQEREQTRQDRLITLREEGQRFDEQATRVRLSQDAERLEQQERSIQVREDELSVSRDVRLAQVNIQAEQQKLDRIRTGIQNQADLARIEAAQQESEARTDRANTDALIKINQQRSQQVEAIAEVESDLGLKLRSAEANLQDVQDRRRKLFGKPSDEELAAAAQQVATIESQLSEARQLRERLLVDISTDLAAESQRIRGSLSGAEALAGDQISAQTSQQNDPQSIPTVRTIEDLANIKEGQKFFMPDPQTNRPVLVQMSGGVPRRVLQ